MNMEVDQKGASSAAVSASAPADKSIVRQNKFVAPVTKAKKKKH